MNLSLRLLLLIFIGIHRCGSRFASNFNCNEIKQSSEYIKDVKNYVIEMAAHFNRRDTPSLDLSTIGLGFAPNGHFLERNHQHILSLNLSRNVMRKIDVIFLLKFPNLQELDLSHNCLSSIEHKNQLSFRNLLFLNLSNNLITNVHPFTFSNISLDTLDLSHNRLIRFWIAGYEVNQLFISHNKISQIEIDSGHYKEMKTFDASYNSLRIFKATVDFDNLLLSNNKLTLDEYFSIRNVFDTLDLSSNHIGEFEWKTINCVKNLNLASNRISTLTLECPRVRFPRIEQLNLDENFLCNFDLSVNVTACLPNVKYISLLRNRLSGTVKIKTKDLLTSLAIKSQIFDHEFFSQLDDDNSIFKN